MRRRGRVVVDCLAWPGLAWPAVACACRGRFGTLMPLAVEPKHGMGVVYGAPIKVQKNEHPTTEQVHELLTRYIAEVNQLFVDYKDTFGYGSDEVLEIH